MSKGVSLGHVGEPPKKPRGMSKAAGKHWNALIKMLTKNDLAPVDVHELRILANLIVQAETLEAAIANDPTDLASGRLYLSVFKEIHRLSSVFGLNPADRNRLGLTDKTEEEDPFNELLRLSKEENN